MPADQTQQIFKQSGTARATRRKPRAERERIAREVADRHGGVAHRRDLRAAGITRHDVASEVAAGRWTVAGRHTVVLGNAPPSAVALLWRAVWETGSGAVLDGASALVAGGLTGFTPEIIDVSMPSGNRRHAVAGVRRHHRRSLGPTVCVGIPRARPEAAALRAAQWARSDRQAALVLCLVVQQRLVQPDRLLAEWRTIRRSRRRGLIGAIVTDVCAGAQSLGELDFAGLCRARGLPEPNRQVVRQQPGGRVYLDVAWDDIGLVVEIDGGHHGLALSPVDDALRQNEVVMGDAWVLRIPVLGLRLRPEAFLNQVVRAHARRSVAA